MVERRDVRTVADVMTRQLVVVGPDTSVEEARWLMNRYRIRHLPVVEGQRLVGIISRLDILRATPSIASTASVWEVPSLLERVAVREIMTRNVMFARPQTPLADAARILVEQQIDALPVVNEEDRLVGIVTAADFLKLVVGGEPDPTREEAAQTRGQ